MKTVVIPARSVQAVTFKGRNYSFTRSPRKGVSVFLRALNQGILEHQGSLSDQLEPRCSGFQVYSDNDGRMFAAACSCNSQWIDVVYVLNPV